MRVILSSVLLLLVGCAHSSKETQEEAERPVNAAVLAELKAAQPSSNDSALIVLYRNTRFGSLFGPVKFTGSLFLDDQAVADVKDDSFNLLELKPGRHSLRVRGVANGLAVPLETTTVVNVTRGSSQFVEVKSVQEFSGASLELKPVTTPPLEEIARDCQKGFTLNLASDDSTPASGKATKL